MKEYKYAGNNWYLLDGPPGECPMCHHAVDPRFIDGVVRESSSLGSSVHEIAFQCPRKKCAHIFIGRYDGEYDRNTSHHHLALRATAPLMFKTPDRPEEVAKLSPQFVAIYGEAAEGEARGLKQIAGCGYRKALEFLIKDFCIAEHPTEKEAIEKNQLANVIGDFIDHPKIKATAERATWLGNDETHYVRKWGDQDITDLKNLIALTVSWVNTHQLTKQYVVKMPEGKK